jgi:hypothetical protein
VVNVTFSPNRYIEGVSYTRNEDDYNHSWTATKHAFTTNLQSSKYAYFISSKPVIIVILMLSKFYASSNQH